MIGPNQRNSGVIRNVGPGDHPRFCDAAQITAPGVRFARLPPTAAHYYYPAAATTGGSAATLRGVQPRLFTLMTAPRVLSSYPRKSLT